MDSAHFPFTQALAAPEIALVVLEDSQNSVFRQAVFGRERSPGFVVEPTDSTLGCKPDASVMVQGYGSYAVIAQPLLPSEIPPGFSIEFIGALLGAILIDLLENSLIRWLEISEFWRDALLGMLILLAVAADAVIMNRLRDLWARSELQVESEADEGRQQEEGSYVA